MSFHRPANRRIISFASCLCLFAALAASGSEFTATQVTRTVPVSKAAKEKMKKAAPPTYNRVYVKAGMDRMESLVLKPVPGKDPQPTGKFSMAMVRIPAKGLVWVISPATKTYQEQRMPGTTNVWTRMLSRMKRVGTENLRGYSCDKYERTMGKRGESGTATVWWSTKLEYPLKAESKSPDLTTTVELMNIREKPVDATLFLPPKGYKKVQATAPAAAKPRK